MAAPIVSVNMCVYNDEKYLAQAIDSVLAQTFTDFEFVIVNDGSIDGTGDILASYDDPRLRIITQPNQGISRARNRALELSRGRYIAVMDADDVSLADRLERQVAFLDTHPDVGVLGTAARFVDEFENREWEYWPPISDEELRHHLIQGNPFIHTSVMMRRSVLEALGGYNEDYAYIVDYELFVRSASRTHLANLPEILVLRRYYLGSVSTTRRTELLRLWLRMRVRYKAFRSLNYPLFYIWYVFQPILFAPIELRPKLAEYLKR